MLSKWRQSCRRFWGGTLDDSDFPSFSSDLSNSNFLLGLSLKTSYVLVLGSIAHFKMTCSSHLKCWMEKTLISLPLQERIIYSKRTINLGFRGLDEFWVYMTNYLHWYFGSCCLYLTPSMNVELFFYELQLCVLHCIGVPYINFYIVFKWMIWCWWGIIYLTYGEWFHVSCS